MVRLAVYVLMEKTSLILPNLGKSSRTSLDLRQWNGCYTLLKLKSKSFSIGSRGTLDLGGAGARSSLSNQGMTKYIFGPLMKLG